MKLKISKETRPLDLGSYIESMRGQVVWVWVNPDRATLRRRELLIEEYNRRLNAMRNVPQVTEKNREKVADRVKEKIEEFNEFALGAFIEGINAWFANIWSQAQDPDTHWTPDELVKLDEADPALYQWMKNQTVQMISEHREREKKG